MSKQYNVETLTLNQLKELISAGNDNVSNQIRVSENGVVYLSQAVGADCLEGVKFRFETFDAGNGYVGKNASEDETYLKSIYNTIKKNWENPKSTYIDFWEPA